MASNGYRLSAGLVAGIAFGLMAAGPVLAEMGQPSPGTGEVRRAAPGAPPVRLHEAKPLAPPNLEAGEEERAAPLETPDVEKSFGTVTRARDGSETRSAPDAKLRDIIRQATEPTGKRSGDRSEAAPRETGDPVFQEGAVARQVFGDDDRVAITTTNSYPFSTFGFIQGRTPRGNWGSCSGTLIGPRTVLTAAHCLYSHEEGGWLSEVIFAPGLNGYDNAPFGAFRADSTTILQGYVDNFRGSYGSVFSWDLGVITLEDAVGEYTGYLGYAHYDGLGGFSANIVGYPGDKDPGTMWRASCQVASGDIKRDYMDYKCDTYRGSSGSSVYAYDRDNRQRMVLGVNVAESPVANTAVRLNAPYVEWVNRVWR